MRFEDYTDDVLPYMYHCHMLLHEDEGMMGQLLVVEPGSDARPGPSAALSGDDGGHHSGHDATGPVEGDGYGPRRSAVAHPHG